MRFVASSLLAFAALAAHPVQAQQQAAPQAAPQTAPQPRATQQPPISAQPVPNDLELSKIIWSTMVAVDQANQSGNYSVLRDMAAPGFQIQNNPSRLSEIFGSLRQSRIDLSNTLLLAPTYTAAPSIIDTNVLRVQGYFGLRPNAVTFDLYYQWVNGDWRLFGVSINPRSIESVQPAGTPPSIRQR